MSPSRLLRSIAYDIVSRRDGAGGWKHGRAQFRALAASSAEQVEAASLQSLGRLLAHATTTVPHYEQAWGPRGFGEPRPATLRDLRRLPLLTKSDLRERKADLVSRAVPESELETSYTGGTTGVQTAFFRDRRCRALRFGRQWGVLERCGYRPGDRRALLWGVESDLLPAGSGARLKQWFREFASADEVMCCTVMTREGMREYYQRLRRFRPSVMYSYPNALEEFAGFIRDEGLAPLTFQRIICTAETLHDHQRKFFRERFGAEVFNLYCSREHGCVGFECPEHDGLHIDSGSVIVEILRDGEPVDPGEQGEIVVTDLMNYGMPLIRSGTGDLAIAGEGPCPCGSPFPKIRGLDGRLSEGIVLPDGAWVQGIMLADLFIGEPSITLAQFLQDDPDMLDVHIVVNGTPRDGFYQDLEAEVRTIVGADIGVRITRVADIARNPRSGKYQDVISRCARHAAIA